MNSITVSLTDVCRFHYQTERLTNGNKQSLCSRSVTMNSEVSTGTASTAFALYSPSWSVQLAST